MGDLEAVTPDIVQKIHTGLATARVDKKITANTAMFQAMNREARGPFLQREIGGGQLTILLPRALRRKG